MSKKTQGEKERKGENQNQIHEAKTCENLKYKSFLRI